MENKQEDNTYYGLNNDIVFKYIFGTEENKKYTIDLIGEILNIDKQKFISSKITNSVKLDRETIRKKQFETDVVIETKDVIYSLEMQNENTLNTEIKNTMYGMKIFSNQLKKGEKYEKTKALIQICIVKDNKQEKGKKILIEKSNIRSEIKRDKKIVKDLFDIYVVDLGIELEKEKITRRLKGWLELIKADTFEKYEEVKREYLELEEVMKKMEYVTEQECVQDHIADDKLLRSNISLWKKEARDEGLKEGIREGKLKGITLGEEKATINIAKILLRRGMSEKEIEEITNLSKKTIMAIKESSIKYNVKN